MATKLDPADKVLADQLDAWVSGKMKAKKGKLDKDGLIQLLLKILHVIFGEKISFKPDSTDNGIAENIKTWIEAKNAGKKAKMGPIAIAMLLIQILKFVFESYSS